MTRPHISVLILLILLLVLFWLAPEVPLLGFAGALLAVALRAPADALAERTGLPGWAAVLIVAAGAVLALGLAAWAAYAPLMEQANQLARDLPNSVQSLLDRISGTAWGDWLLARAEPAQMLEGSGAVGGVARAAGNTLGALGNAVLVVLLGLYFGTRRADTLRGLVRLVHPALDDDARDALAEFGTVLRGWLLGQGFAMVVSGLLTWVGLLLLGVPLAGVLAVITAILGFIPIVGPLIAAVPAMLLALTQDPILALWVALLFIGVQTIEGNILTPMVQSETADLPPAVLILAQTLMGGFFGLLGVALSAPLAAVTLVLVRRAYVEGWLERPEQQLKGESIRTTGGPED